MIPSLKMGVERRGGGVGGKGREGRARVHNKFDFFGMRY